LPMTELTESTEPQTRRDKAGCLAEPERTALGRPGAAHGPHRGQKGTSWPFAKLRAAGTVRMLDRLTFSKEPVKLA
jgi:hypothetical protein